jgi:Ca2+-binding EF-hand superfamily protein
LGEKISKDEYKEMFRRADLDCDGFVTVEDIQNIMNGKVYWDA